MIDVLEKLLNELKKERDLYDDTAENIAIEKTDTYFLMKGIAIGLKLAIQFIETEQQNNMFYPPH